MRLALLAAVLVLAAPATPAPHAAPASGTAPALRLTASEPRAAAVHPAHSGRIDAEARRRLEVRRRLLAEQPERIAAAVAKLAPRVPGRTNVFYVGFAGYGEQRVFRKEEELARRILGERLGSLGRSVQLVNDIHDRRTYPLATFDNLRETLRLIGRRMNRDEDVLVLVLTSHGSPDDGIAITNGRVVEDALSPRDVHQVLAEAGIRWRIVIASACYAGIFIRPLRTDTTLVMTAADSRHSSFGCADDRDLTYFGEALFADAIPHACSLEDSFADARRIIRRRESEEGEVHSNPQIYVGARMRAKLRAMEQAPMRVAAGARLRCTDRRLTSLETIRGLNP